MQYQLTVKKNYLLFKEKTKYVIFILLLSYLNSPYLQAANKAQAGQVKFFNIANTHLTDNPSSSQKKWLQRHYQRLRAHSPSFDRNNAWYKNALAYIDSYAIYENDALARQHPEWIMHDARGNKLYIPWDCSGGRCTQYAGDFSNPAFRRYMVNKIKATVKRGYRGVWLDDVNLIWRVGNNNDVNEHITPIDSNTGKPMTLANWRRYFANYMQEVRAALPKSVEIAHNAIWYADTMQKENPDITRQIQAATYINLERGANDGGLVGGSGQWGYETFLKYIDYVHKKGTAVVLMDETDTAEQRDYGLATWFLISQGNDFFNSMANHWIQPNNWWPGFSLNLGQPLNDYYKWKTLFRRDFACGSVLLNQPNSQTVSTAIGNGYKNLQRQAISRVSLSAKTAAILTTTCNPSRTVPSRKFR
jgi:Hypothetical glycosyl hydrolase family 15